MRKRQTTIMTLPLIVVMSFWVSRAFANEPVIDFDAKAKQLHVVDVSKNLALCINVDKRCQVEQVNINRRDVLHPEYGVCSAIKVNEDWYTTRKDIASPKVAVDGNTATVTGITFGPEDMPVRETWTFRTKADRIDWRITRTYGKDGVLEDTYFAGWTFAAMDTWTGALLDTGGVAWCRFLERPNMTLGNHAEEVTFWNRENDAALRMTPTVPDGQQMAVRFTHQPNGAFTFAQNIGDTDFECRHDLSRFIREGHDVWKAFEVKAGTVEMNYTLQALTYSETYDRGDLKGIDEGAVREIFNTILRYGTIDRNHTGGNGWRTGWICLHEQWYSSMAAAMACPDYTRNVSSTYDYFKDNAVRDDGRVFARFKNDKGDYKPSGYTDKGFFEPGWGILMDSQPDYVIVVSEHFHNTGDMDWLKGQKETCEKVLDFVLARDHDHDGLLEMMNDYHSDEQGSDWIDIIWAAHENAFVNAEMYYAMTLWSELETLLGDHAMAKKYARAAAKLRKQFNKTVAHGGFWNPEKQWYIYWRDKDNSIHGDNFVIPVNFMALGYGLCDDDKRRAAILDQLEVEMVKEALFSWPLSVYPYKEVEGKDTNFPFPNYENGHLFLSWNELGVRIYADYNPAIAMKYVRNVLDRYEEDGLAHQRYSRIEQKGMGHDILSGNGNAVVGLYSAIYGIHPRYDRLFLDPHLTPELNGTKLKYWLRDQDYEIALSQNDYTISVGDCSVRGKQSFGMDVTDAGLNYYRDKRGVPALIASSPVLTLDATKWIQGQPAWTSTSTKTQTVEYVISGFPPDTSCGLQIQGQDVPKTLCKSDAQGRIHVSVEHEAGQPVSVLITPPRQ